MTLEDLGYRAEMETFRRDSDLGSFGVGRVISEHKERYIVRSAKDEYEAEIVGSLRFSAHERSDFPAVGDWVAISEYDDGKALIHAVFPRKSLIERQAVGKYGEKQVIATNIDYALIVQAVDRDFNINRIERYLTICYVSDINPVIILNKIDLIDESALAEIMHAVRKRIPQVPVVAVSNASGSGIETLASGLEKGKTYCMLGSSGVGKSTLINNLSGNRLMETGQISASTQKGRHITSHRELFLLDQGGILIDNPGMREVGITDSAGGLDRTFGAILELSGQCRYTDCTHMTEAGCAVIEALDRGELDPLAYENYVKMEREKEHFEATVAERRKKDRDFGKMVKNFKKGRNHNNY